jgi:ribosomal protein S12 methylthiotransferase
VGREIEVLIEAPHEESDDLLVGRHAGQAPEIDGQVIINDVPEGGVSPGDIVKVMIDEAYEYDLIGGVTEVVLKAPVAVRPSVHGARLPVFNAHR